MRLSIVVPLYNVQDYIKSCLNSILPQIIDNENVELIIVDDGTPDASAAIAQDMIKGLSNCQIIHQPNQGLSAARNSGLNIAKGEYVWFIDSDDSIVENCIEGILAALEIKPDILQINYQLIYEDGRDPKPVSSKFSDYNTLSGKEVICMGSLPAPAQFSIYNRQFLLDNDLKFFPGMLHEDTEFKPRATYLAKTIAFHLPIVYNYLQRTSGNITSNFKNKNAKDLIFSNLRLHDFYKNKVHESKCKIAFKRIIGKNFNTVIANFNKLNNTDKDILIAHLGKNRFIYYDMLTSNRIKYIIEGIFFILHTKYAIKFLSCFQ